MAAKSHVRAKTKSIVARPYRKELIQNSDGTWFAHVAELQGCMTEGDTPEEAYENLEDAMVAWVGSQLENGQPIPPPAASEDYSGKFLMRVPKSLHRQLAECADREGVSLNQFALAQLAGAVGNVSFLLAPEVARLLQLRKERQVVALRAAIEEGFASGESRAIEEISVEDIGRRGRERRRIAAKA